MPVIAKGGVDTLCRPRLPCIWATYARKLRESWVKANAVGEKRLISALSMPSQASDGAHFLAH